MNYLKGRLNVDGTTQMDDTSRRSPSRVVRKSAINSRQTREENLRRMEAHKSLLFQLRELGAENMLRFEEFGRSTAEILSGSYFHKRLAEFKEYLDSYKEEEEKEEETVIRVTKMEIIQKQIEELKIKMEKIHSEMEKKNEEIEKARREVLEKGVSMNESETNSSRMEDTVD